MEEYFLHLTSNVIQVSKLGGLLLGPSLSLFQQVIQLFCLKETRNRSPQLLSLSATHDATERSPVSSPSAAFEGLWFPGQSLRSNICNTPSFSLSTSCHLERVKVWSAVRAFSNTFSNAERAACNAGYLTGQI